VIPTDALRDPVMINFGGISQGVVTWDVPSIMGLYAQVPKDPWLAQTNKFQVHEKIQTGFLRFVIDSKLGSVPVRGNLGLQYVRSEQNSDGFAWNDGAGTPAGGAVIPVSGGTSYSDVLPSLNLVFDLREDLLLRFGLGKTMARPRMDDMRAGADQPALTAISQSPDETIGTWSAGGGGKPEIQPWRAKSVDLTLEKYFQKRSYVAVAGFLKKLDSFIYQRSSERDFTGSPTTTRISRPAVLRPTRIAIRTSARSPRRTMAAAARFTASSCRSRWTVACSRPRWTDSACN
jgi:iron complex outermembrane receptor protein